MQLYHHPLCAPSRAVRLLCGEFGLELELIEERTWDRRTEFLAMNPTGQTPLLIDEQVGTVPNTLIIAEYLDETRGLALADRRLLPENIKDRIEVRRLSHWFNTKFFDEVGGPLVHEKVYKRYMTNAHPGAGAPDMLVIRAAKHNIRYHLQYMSWLLQERKWLAGAQMTLADLVAAAHLSTVDYLGDIPWEEDDALKTWYASIKSRPSFRTLLADRLPGVTPSAHYTNLDF